MKLARQFIMLAAMVATVHYSGTSQVTECGTIISKQQLEAERARISRREQLAPFIPGAITYHIPLAIHVCRRADRTGGLTLAQVDSAMNYLNAAFDPFGIRFFQYGDIIYIDNDFFYRVPDSQIARDLLRRESVVPNTINVYFTNLIGLCGQATFPADSLQGVLVDSTCAGSVANPSTFAHEIGHYLDLYHTHDTTFAVECPNGSNCATAGDLICDTPADPDLTDRVDSTCAYTGGVAPPGGCDATPYSPQPNNLMSYSRKECRTLFTGGQAARMIATLSGSRRNLHTNVKYVDRNWTGSQNGTPEEPFRTVLQAVNAAAPGNHIFVRPGSYPEIFSMISAVKIERWNAPGSVVIGQ